MLTHQHGERLWSEVTREPYRRRDGSSTVLIVWRCQCAAPGCGGTVEARTPADDYARSKAFASKHCAAHKRTVSKRG